jgi:hypothetical protein
MLFVSSKEPFIKINLKYSISIIISNSKIKLEQLLAN